MSINRYYGYYTPACDYCDTTLLAEESYFDAVAAKKSAGWLTRKLGGEWEDICLECQKELGIKI